MTKDRSAPLPVRYAFSVVAATCADFATYPLDLAKTRLQVQGDKNLLHRKKKGVIGMCREVIKKEGLAKLYFGMSPSIGRQVVYAGFRMTTYQHFRSKMGKNPPLYQTAMLGMACGGVGELLANPFSVLKIQMQNEGRRYGLEPRVTTCSHSFKYGIVDANFFYDMDLRIKPIKERSTSLLTR